ncbi:MAG TPA: hypothetical protein VNR11_15590 [Xanthobacteraceae bacterium]|nr:hypothetical protein [Xanthobacteraceae bacterium]
MSPMGRIMGRTSALVLLALGLLVILGANAHLLYVATTSQPDCVGHVRLGDAPAAPATFSAAKSACAAR